MNKIIIANEAVVFTPKFKVGDLAYHKHDDCIRRVKIRGVSVHMDCATTHVSYAVTCVATVGYKAYTNESAWEHSVRSDANAFYEET